MEFTCVFGILWGLLGGPGLFYVLLLG